MDEIDIGWEGVEASVKALCFHINNKPEDPIDLVVGINRGGVIPARLVAEELGVHDIEIIKTNDSVNDIFFKLNGYLNIVFIDDINDTGKTWQGLSQLMSHISMRGKYRMGTLYERYNTLFKDSLHGIKLDHDQYINFPWEQDEALKDGKYSI